MTDSEMDRCRKIQKLEKHLNHLTYDKANLFDQSLKELPMEFEFDSESWRPALIDRGRNKSRLIMIEVDPNRLCKVCFFSPSYHLVNNKEIKN